MPNVTYDPCKSLVAHTVVLTNLSFSLAGSLVWFDPDTQENVVYNLGDIAWVLASTALVWIMIPGVGFFYSGLLRRKNALSMIWLSMVVLAVVSFQVSLRHPLTHHAKSDPQPVVLLGLLTRLQRNRRQVHR